MAIPVQQFPFMSFAQANPAIVGARTGIDIVKEGASIPQLSLQMQTLRKQLGEAPFREAILQAQAQQAPLRTQQLEQAVKFGPLKQALGVAGQEQKANRFGAAYQLAKAVQSMPIGLKSQWISENQKAWDAVLGVLGRKALPDQPISAAQAAVNREFAKLYPQQVGQPTTAPSRGPTPAAAPDLQQQYRGLPQALPGTLKGTPVPRAAAVKPTDGYTPPVKKFIKQNPYGLDASAQKKSFQSSSSDIQREKWVGQMKANLETIGEDATAKKRAASSVTMLHWLNNNRDQYARRINNALQYVGADGKIKRGIELTLREKNKAQADWKWFMNDFKVAYDNQIKFIEAMGGTDTQTQEARNMMENPTNFFSNPKLAKKNLNQMFSMWDDLAYANLRTAQPVNKGIIQKMQGLPAGPMKSLYLNVGPKPAPGKGQPSKIAGTSNAVTQEAKLKALMGGS